ncbi:hypothetical protein HJC23_000337 [Cyclotella cryptica]|uniref:Uncharacterized protein n=1 Tax=Cyclotella cryptica TaxID=29204 RepID=A0ABD3PPJ4_9STRA
MSSKPEQYSCMGTNRISITNDDRSSSSDGMISLFLRENDEKSVNRRLSDHGSDSDDCLHLVITDGVDTFYAPIMSKDIKQISHENHKTPLDQVASILLYNKEGTQEMIERHYEQEKYKISYKRMQGQLLGGEHDSTTTTTVKTSILKTCFNNLVRPVWEGSVSNVHHSNYKRLPSFVQNALPNSYHQSTATPPSSGLAFPLMLRNTISKLQDEAESLRNQNKQLNADALRWKATARHLETRHKLDALTKQSAKNMAVGTLANKSLPRKEREAILDDEDNHDYAVWDKETVERLAAGPRGSKGKSKKQHAKVDEEGGDVSSSVLGDTFRNPHTGVLEISNYKRMFDSDDEDEVERSSKKRKE